jgi:hypothetical protein
MIKHAGIYGNNYGAGSPVVLTHPNDIAKVAAEELLDLGFTGQTTRYIASDERNSVEIAAALGAAVGITNLPYVEFTDEQNLGGMVQAGLPEELAKNFVEMGTAIRNGKLFEDYRKHAVELGATKLEDFAKEFAGVYAAS